MAAPFDELTEVAVVDCETTGVDPEQDRIVSLAVVLTDLSQPSAQETRTFDTRLNPGIPIPAGATRVHGLRDQDVAECPSFGDMAQALKDFVGDRPLVGFNVRFDKRFLNAELKRAGLVTFARKRSYCAQEVLQGIWGYRPSLAQALARAGIAFDRLHNALPDAIATAKLAGLISTSTRSEIAWFGAASANDPPSKAQLDYIEALGGTPSSVKTKREASDAIDRLKGARLTEAPRARPRATLPTRAPTPIDYAEVAVDFDEVEFTEPDADESEPPPSPSREPARPSVLLMLSGMVVFWTLLALGC